MFYCCRCGELSKPEGELSNPEEWWWEFSKPEGELSLFAEVECSGGAERSIPGEDGDHPDSEDGEGSSSFLRVERWERR